MDITGDHAANALIYGTIGILLCCRCVRKKPGDEWYMAYNIVGILGFLIIGLMIVASVARG